MVKLELKANGWTDEATIRLHVRSAAERGLRQFRRTIKERGETALIVGTAPSLAKHFDEIKERKKSGDVIYSVNQAHDYLIQRGVLPDYFVAIDPCAGWEPILHPRVDVTYLLASICHPSLFDLCPAESTIVWHPPYSGWVPDEMQKLRKTIIEMVPGGSTAALRSIWLAYLSGFRSIRLYGLDSSYGEAGEYYCDDAMNKWIDPALIATCRDQLEVCYGGKKFLTTTPLATQAMNFAKDFEKLEQVCELQVIGDGLLPWVSSQLNQRKERRRYV